MNRQFTTILPYAINLFELFSKTHLYIVLRCIKKLIKMGFFNNLQMQFTL
jgi:hypothetical protein